MEFWRSLVPGGRLTLMSKNFCNMTNTRSVPQQSYKETGPNGWENKTVTRPRAPRYRRHCKLSFTGLKGNMFKERKNKIENVGRAPKTVEVGLYPRPLQTSADSQSRSAQSPWPRVYLSAHNDGWAQGAPPDSCPRSSRLPPPGLTAHSYMCSTRWGDQLSPREPLMKGWGSDW